MYFPIIMRFQPLNDSKKFYLIHQYNFFPFTYTLGSRSTLNLSEDEVIVQSNLLKIPTSLNNENSKQEHE